MRTLLTITAVAMLFLMSVATASTSSSTASLKNVRIPRGCKEEDIVQHHSFLPPMLGEYWSAGLHHWDFGMATAVTDEYVRLTPNKQSREGYMWNDVPSHLASWTVYLSFRTHAKSSLGGDGFAMWYTDSTKKEGGSLFGYPSNPKGLGIIFDTFDNNGQKDNPGVSIILGNGQESFRVDNDLLDQRLGGCTFNFRNTDASDYVEAVIEYNDDTLTMSLFSNSNKQQCASIPNLALPDGYYFGLTAHTGQLADNHDIRHFVVTATEAERAKEREEKENMPAEDKKKETSKFFFRHDEEKYEKEKHRQA